MIEESICVSINNTKVAPAPPRIEDAFSIRLIHSSLTLQTALICTYTASFDVECDLICILDV
jgi:hypothetical protein